MYIGTSIARFSNKIIKIEPLSKNPTRCGVFDILETYYNLTIYSMDKVQHFEIPADDIARARAFYEASFGWKTSEFPMPDGSPYVGLHTGPTDDKNMLEEKGFINGGMVQRGGAFPITGPTVAVVVQNLDEALEKVKAAGGSIMMDKKDIAGMGYYAYVKDTEGNTVGVWQDIKKG